MRADRAPIADYAAQKATRYAEGLFLRVMATKGVILSLLLPTKRYAAASTVTLQNKAVSPPAPVCLVGQAAAQVVVINPNYASEIKAQIVVVNPAVAATVL